MLKKEARIYFKQQRAKLSEEMIEDKSFAIANQLLKLEHIFNDKNLYYHLFLSIANQKEINTEAILNILFAKNKEVVVSKSNFENQTMTNYLLTDNTKIAVNKYGIPEPIDGIEVPSNKIDVVFIPLLAYDKEGNRVGYGKGFYDRFLSDTNAIKIGLSFYDPIEKITDTNVNDIALNYCITPEKIHSF